MEKKKTKKKWREIRSAVTMMCVMAAMMSTATYAWFTLTSSPTVTGLQMQAVSEGGLEVALTNEESAFSNAITITANGTNTNGTVNPLKLKPVTPGTTAGTFHLPTYEGGYVSGLDTAITGEDLNDIVAVYTYYIKAKEATDTSKVKVGIITGNATQSAKPELSDDGVAQATGSFIREKKANEGNAADTQHAASAVRVGFLINGTTWKTWEPNQDKNFNNGTSAPVKDDAGITAPTADVTSKENGAIVTGGTADGTISNMLFELGEDAATVKMYVWLEGTDNECANEIQADLLEGQIQFTIVQ